MKWKWNGIFVRNILANILCISDQKCLITGHSQNVPVIGILTPRHSPALRIFFCKVGFSAFGKLTINVPFLLGYLQLTRHFHCF